MQERPPRTAGGARALPGRYYTSSEIFARECERIFSDRWLYVGRASSLARAGDYELFEFAPRRPGPEPVPHESVLVVRGSDGELRSFYNVCRHRGARLCTEAGRGQGSIRCPYHAWTYALDGRLIGAPNMAEVAGFDRGDYPLKPVATAVWEGFVFINLAPEPVPFATAFAPIYAKIGAWQVGRLALAYTQSYEVAANWKLLFQNYSECYHCPIIHPALNAVTPFRGASNDLESGEFLGGPMQIADAEGSMTESGRACGPALVSGPERQLVYYYTLFPSMFLSLHPDYVLVHRIDPVAIDRTRVHCEWLFDPGYRSHAGSDPQQAVEFWDRVNREDWRVCELSQQGVRSRAYTPGPYAELESVTAAFDRAYLEALGEPPRGDLLAKR
jgi:glycine betaine catabolism A